MSLSIDYLRVEYHNSINWLRLTQLNLLISAIIRSMDLMIFFIKNYIIVT